MKLIKKNHLKVLLTLLAATALLNACFLKQDRTTVVYGTITDGKGQPVDSIMVVMQGKHFLTYETLASTYSDQSGNYELSSDVPKKFNAVNSLIPALPKDNPKFQNQFESFKALRDTKPTANCCNSDVGKKTRYDFQLKSK
jgi:hypothetical protein